MPNNVRGVHASETRCDLDGFPLRTGSVADIKPLVEADWPPLDGRKLDGWVTVGTLAESNLADMTVVIAAADLVILSRDLIVETELTAPATELPACGERVVLLEVPDEPIPATVVEAIARYAAKHKQTTRRRGRNGAAQEIRYCG